MKKLRLQAFIAEQYVDFVLHKAKAEPGLTGMARDFRRFLNGSTSGLQTLVKAARIEGDTSPANLAMVLDKGISALKTQVGVDLSGVSMDVEIGANAAHVAVISMLHADGSRLSLSDRDAFVQSWIQQNWGLQGGIVKQAALQAVGRYIVTHVRQDVVTVVEDVCEFERLRLASCLPSLARRLATSERTSQSIEACIELGIDGARMPLVQYVVADESGPAGVVRAWVPSVGEHDVHRFGRRVAAQYGMAKNDMVAVRAWPQVIGQV